MSVFSSSMAGAHKNIFEFNRLRVFRIFALPEPTPPFKQVRPWRLSVFFFLNVTGKDYGLRVELRTSMHVNNGLIVSELSKIMEAQSSHMHINIDIPPIANQPKHFTFLKRSFGQQKTVRRCLSASSSRGTARFGRTTF